MAIKPVEREKERWPGEEVEAAKGKLWRHRRGRRRRREERKQRLRLKLKLNAFITFAKRGSPQWIWWVSEYEWRERKQREKVVVVPPRPTAQSTAHPAGLKCGSSLLAFPQFINTHTPKINYYSLQFPYHQTYCYSYS